MFQRIGMPFTMACLSLVTHAQDLVVNGGFEQHGACPKAVADQRSFKAISDVRSVRGSPEYYHACGTATGVPSNWSGHQTAHEGSAYVGLVLTASSNECDEREFIQLSLQEPLTNGQRYRVSFWVSVADRSGYYTDRIGACFSTSDRSRKGSITGLLDKPDIEQPLGAYLADTSAWMQVQGVYHAKGGERYIVVGNFQACGRSTRKAVISNKGEGVSVNMKRLADLDLDPNKARSAYRRALMNRAYYFLDMVSVAPLGPDGPVQYLTPGMGCDSISSVRGAPELVPDPGFDTNVAGSEAQWRNASGGTPDLMDGQAGIYLYSAMDRHNREFIRTDLGAPLDPCGTYRFSLRIRREASYGFAVDRIGLALVDTFIMDRRRGPLDAVPSWVSASGQVMDNTDRWITLCGVFDAPGCSRTLLIGNFLPDDSTVVLRTDMSGGPFAYYYVDDVSLWRIGRVPGCITPCVPPPSLADSTHWTGADTPWPGVTFQFEVARSEPLGDLSPMVDSIQVVLRANPTQRLLVTGYADRAGDPEANQQLSRQRAERVRDILVDGGIPADRIRVLHFGSDQARAEATDLQGRVHDRKVLVGLEGDR